MIYLRTSLKAIARSNGFSNLLRRSYKYLPLSSTQKQKLKQFYLRQTGVYDNSNNSSQAVVIPYYDTVQRDYSTEALPLMALSAKQYDPDNPWVVVVEHRIPTPDRDSGSMRMSSIIRLLLEMGFRITFISDSEEPLPQYRKALEKLGVDVLQGSKAAYDHFEVEGGKYHFVLLSRPEVAFQYMFVARAHALQAKVIYDTVDLHWIRIELEMRVLGNPNLSDTVGLYRRMELLNSECADIVIAITNEEKNRLLLESHDMNVTVLPNIHEMHPPIAAFDQREGMLFIGNFWHKPNEDAVMYFVKDILPLIIEKIPETVFFIIGSNMPDSIKSLSSRNVRPLGFVMDVTPYFESCRLFVAPLRFGAGMKGKIGQSMSHGLPIVTTPIGAEGIGLQHGEHALIATNSEDFADSVVRLYWNEHLWRRLSAESLAYLESNYSLVAVRKQMKGIFGTRNETAA